MKNPRIHQAQKVVNNAKVKESLIYQDVQALDLLSSAKIFMEGFLLYPEGDPMAKVMAQEWVTALEVWANRTGVTLHE